MFSADLYQLAGARISLLLFLLLGVLGYGTYAQNPAHAAEPPLQSDKDAVQALQNVITKSGGQQLWSQIRSAEETFSLTGPGTPNVRTMLLLDDWSLQSMRYRRRERDQVMPPVDHNGTPTFTAISGRSKQDVPELDQPRVLVDRLPAAAAEVMLRRHEYAFKISQFQKCPNGMTCIEIFREASSIPPMMPEQVWTISDSTGLPSEIRFRVAMTGNLSVAVWKAIAFLQYSTQDGVVIPTSISTDMAGHREIYALKSFKKNPGFDISKFDQEPVE